MNIKSNFVSVLSFILVLLFFKPTPSEATDQDVALSAENPVALPQLHWKYGNGLSVTDSNDLFSMTFKFRIQNRYTYDDNDDNSTSPDNSEFLVRRARLRVEGFVLNPKLTYKIQLSFTRNDMDWDNSQFPNVLRDANASYQLTSNDQILVGLAKLPGNRQRVISSGRQEFVDRSIANALFNIDRDIGLQWWHRFGQSAPLWLKTAISNGQGRGSTQKNNGMAYTYRLEWLPLGTFKDGGDYFEGDLAFEENLRLSLAAGMSTNRKASRVGGQIGRDIEGNQVRNLETFIADVLLKYRGWAWSSECFRRNVENPVVSASQTLFDGQGWNTQLTYTFRNMYHTGGRWSQTRPDDQLQSLLTKETQYTVVFGRYLDHHQIKIQSDVSYAQIYNYSSNVTLDNYAFRLQLELGI